MSACVKFVAVSVALALVLTLPGLLSYQALAAPVAGQAGAKVAPVSNGFIGSPLTRTMNTLGPAVHNVSPVSLTGSLHELAPAPGVIVPLAAPAVLGAAAPQAVAAPLPVVPAPAQAQVLAVSRPEAVSAEVGPLTALERLASPSGRKETAGGAPALESAAARLGEAFDGKPTASAPLELGASLALAAQRPAAAKPVVLPRLEFSDRIPETQRPLLREVLSETGNAKRVLPLAKEALRKYNRSHGRNATLADINHYAHYFHEGDSDYVYQVIIEIGNQRIGMFVAYIDKATHALVIGANDD